ncbi:MAG: Oligopeptide transport ATP-binding protein OppD [Candidatus Moanabacter tarae]|uniref:Oligopeptide transport ATP-binding protein OppD n=1 Tax=Candidatus Moanibacter tarae TaxID=2200854 RepID=A0A2Z4AHR0_9BACT|nr:MAG: Oligopeptide transport ATP-binding protein OppD [Candidatus Moanabacter tarae]
MSNANQKGYLEVKNLNISFNSREGILRVVKNVSFTLETGKTLAIVGESGSGKTVSALALTRLLPGASVCKIAGQVLYQGTDLLRLSRREIRKYRGKEIAYIFQDPSTSLNPVLTIGYQIEEAIKLHLPKVEDKKGRVINALHQVGIRNPEIRINDYPHQLSGGMQQRVMIAMALASEPRILIADEPTTALDVTIQAQIIDLLRQIRRDTDMAVILITHNFGIVSDFADDVIVMFRGEIVESGPTDRVLKEPEHAYTKALISCIPQMGKKQRRLNTIDYKILDK